MGNPSEEAAMRKRYSRRAFLTGTARLGAGLAVGGVLAGCSAAAPASSPAVVDDKTELTVGIWGGLWANTVKQVIAPEIEKKFNARVFIKEGAPASRQAALLANPQEPEVDISYGNGDLAFPLLKAGVYESVDPAKVPEYSQLYKVAQEESGGYGVGVVEFGIAYDSRKISQAPTTLLDLWKPEYKGKVALPNMDSVMGQCFMAMLAKAMGKDLRKDIQDIYQKLLELKPSVASYFSGSSQIMPQLEQGNASIAPLIGQYVTDARAKGSQLAWVRPKEGAIGLVTVINVTKYSKHKTLAYEWIRIALQETSQVAMAKAVFTGPTNKTVKLPDDLARQVLYGEEAVSKLNQLDWPVVNGDQPKWTEWWNKNMS